MSDNKSMAILFSQGTDIAGTHFAPRIKRGRRLRCEEEINKVMGKKGVSNRRETEGQRVCV